MSDADQTIDNATRAVEGKVLHALDLPASEVDRLLDSLAIPATEESRQMLTFLGADVGMHLDLLITDDVAAQLWTEWHRERRERIEDDSFRRAFRNMLAEGVRLGFSADRFRNISRSLPDPVEGGENWAAAFEGTIAGKEKCRITLSFDPERYRAFMRSNSENSEKSWSNMLSMMKDGLFYELGIIFPPITVRPDETLKDHEFRVEWNDVQLPPQKGLASGRALANDTVERLRLLNVAGEPAINPANGSECTVIDAAYTEVCEQAGLTTWNPMGYTILALSGALRRIAGAFVNRYLVWYLLGSLSRVRPTLVNEVRERIDVDVLVLTLRGLLDEEITIRDLSFLLEEMLSTQGKVRVDGSKYIVFAHNAFPAALAVPEHSPQLTVADYVSNVRASLKRYISHKYTRGQNTLIVYLLDPQIEARLSDPAGLRPEERTELMKCVRNEVESLPPTAQQPVILTTFECRLRLRNELRHEFPKLMVVSYQELSPDMNIQPIARISSEDWPEST